METHGGLRYRSHFTLDLQQLNSSPPRDPRETLSVRTPRDPRETSSVRTPRDPRETSSVRSYRYDDLRLTEPLSPARRSQYEIQPNRLQYEVPSNRPFTDGK